MLALLRLQNGRQVRAKLHQISVTGGVLHAEKPLDEGISIEIIFHLCSTTVRCQALAFFPLWATQGYLQPFEFQELDEKDRTQLQAEIDGLVKSLSGTVVPPGMPLIDAPEPASVTESTPENNASATVS